MKNSDLKKLRDRDSWCWHCGTESTLVPHHRANRGAGGSKVLDTLQNVILVCAEFNQAMESDANVANWARDLGLKLSRYASPSAAVFDNYLKKWFYLDEKGNRFETEPPTYLI
jgi:hypothetical protein